MSTWTSVDASFPLATCRYSFGPGEATSLAIGIDGGIAIVSPPCRVPDAAYEEAAALGPIKALVASNAYHHLGLAPWKQRFPDAKVFAPAQAIARVSKQSGLTGIAPLSELAPMAGPRVDMFDMPHYKSGEVLVRARTAQGCVWYTTDILMNLPTTPGLFGFIFKVTGSAPGFKFNNFASLIMVKSKPALKRWLIERAEEDPPTTIVSSHGDVVRLSEPMAQLRSVISA
jgi:hypothetical protein